jgi:hypothetical protein
MDNARLLRLCDGLVRIGGRNSKYEASNDFPTATKSLLIAARALLHSFSGDQVIDRGLINSIFDQCLRCGALLITRFKFVSCNTNRFRHFVDLSPFLA